MNDQHVYVLGSGTSGTILVYCLLSKGCCVTLVDEQIDPPCASAQGDLAWQEYFGLPSLQDLWTIEACKSSSVEIFSSLPQRSLKGRIIGYPCRKGIGGNSNINAMMHAIGHDSVYEKYWPKSWNAETIRKYEKIVDNILSPGEQRTSGNMSKVFDSMLVQATAENARQSIIKNYPSCIASNNKKRLKLIKLLEKLSPESLSRLRLIRGNVVRVGLNNSTVATIELANSETIPVEASSKVVVSCGAIKTPMIIYNSLSTSEKFTDHRLTTSHLKDIIGKYALDHFTLPYVCFGNWKSGWLDSVSSPINGVHGWTFLDAEGNFHKDDSPLPPRTQLIFVDGSILVGLVDIILPRWENQSTLWTLIRNFSSWILTFVLSLSLVRWLTGGIFGVLVCLVQPEIKGQCSFEEIKATTGTDGLHKICIDSKLFAGAEDQKALHKAYLKARNILQTSNSKGNLSYFELLPGPLFNGATSLSKFVEFVSWVGTTYFHISGTCPMDRFENGILESSGVLSDTLQVKGITNLYVADASVFPAIPSFPTSKLAMIVGARAADLLFDTTSKSSAKSKLKMQL